MKKYLKQIPQTMGAMAMGGMIGGMGAMAYGKMMPGTTNPMSGATEMMPAMGTVAMMGPMVGMLGSTAKQFEPRKTKRRR